MDNQGTDSSNFILYLKFTKSKISYRIYEHVNLDYKTGDLKGSTPGVSNIRHVGQIQPLQGSNPAYKQMSLTSLLL